MNKWNELGAWDVAGGVAVKAQPYLKSTVSALDELVVAARAMVHEQWTLVVSNHQQKCYC
jgi:hypothetical protein